MQDQVDILPGRLNGEPSIFRGCSLSELITLCLVSVVTVVPAFIVITWMFGKPMMGVGLGLLATIGVVYLGSTILQRLKRGRPIGYYQLSIRIKLESLGILKTGAIRHSQIWDLGRSIKNVGGPKKLSKRVSGKART